MQVGTKEFYDVISGFEKEYKFLRLDKEPEKLWKKGIVYQDGETNKLYLAYRLGYSLGRCNYL